MSKVSFKIVSIYPGTEPKLLSMESVSRKTGGNYFLDEYGKRFDRVPHAGERISNIVLNSVETYELNGEQKKRVFALVEYEIGFTSTNKELQLANNLKEAQHAFVKEHNLIKIRDENGNNINPNSGSMVAFELIEESEEIKKQVIHNSKVTDYSSIAKKMFEESPEAFVNFCYAYGIQNVESTAIESLFNEVMYKISINPDYFNEIYTHKNRKFLSLFNRALETTVNDEQIIDFKENYYYFEGSPIGVNVEEAMFYFDKHPVKKQILEMKMQVEPESAIEVVRLPETPVNLTPSEREKLAKEKMDSGRIQGMKMEVGRAINKFNSDINKAKKEGESTADIEEAFLTLKKALRVKYIDIEAAYDSYFEKKFNGEG